MTLLKKHWFYLPNLVGYLRLLLLGLFLYIPVPFIQLFLIIAVFSLDLVDGPIARKLKQNTLFGARLDLFVDMISHLVLTLYVAYFVPNFYLKILFILIAANDFVSYALSIFRFYGKKRSLEHKKILQTKGFFLPIYYTKTALFFINVGQDVYFFHWIYQPAWWLNIFTHLTVIALIFRQLAVVEQTFYLLKPIRAIDRP